MAREREVTIMKRREFVKVAATTAAVAAAGSFPAPAVAQNVKELKMVTTWPKNFPGVGTGAERLAKRITEASDGQLSIKVYAAGELVPPFESFDAVSQGTAEMYHGADYYFQGKSKAFNFFTSVPFGLTASEINSWIYFNGGQELWDELSAQFDVKPFMAGNTGVQMGGWFAREVNTLEDFKGLKFRMPGLGGEVMRRLGAAAVALPGGEIFAALQSGAIDGTEWVGPWNDLAFGFYKVVKYYYYPGFHEPGSALSMGFNKKIWDGLSKSHQQLIESACQAENDMVLAEFNAKNGAALKTLVTEHGVKLRRFSNEILNAIGHVSGEVVAEVGASDPLAAKVYESFIKSRTESIAWSKLGDQGYWNARLLPFKYG
jgi:TRAP-type mannitol/chloroaromatic compound transport system substrate-binding protein